MPPPRARVTPPSSAGGPASASACTRASEVGKGTVGNVTRSLVMRATFFQAALAAVTLLASASPESQSLALAPPGFHHLHLGSTNPEAAIAFYTKAFPSTSTATWGGIPAL